MTLGNKIKKIIDSYYHFFDCKLKNTTIIIGLVGVIVLCVWIFVGWRASTESFPQLKANILEVGQDQFVDIQGKKYKLSLEEIKE